MTSVVVTARRERRRRLLVVLVVVAVGVGALGATRFVKSPVTVTAGRHVPHDTLVVRGQVGPVRSVVTGLPVRAGDKVRAGQVVAEVSGRPVLVLPGEVPAYRDILPGARGADVAQLQNALTNLGYGIGDDVNGLYGAGTKAAVVAVYAEIGYEVTTTGPDDVERVRAAARRVRDATDILHAAVRETPGSQSPSVATARQAVTDAVGGLAALVASTGVTVPYGEVVFVPKLPARVDAVQARVGDEATDSLLTLAVGDG
jgi:HlyD family secretion protein